MENQNTNSAAPQKRPPEPMENEIRADCKHRPVIRMTSASQTISEEFTGCRIDDVWCPNIVRPPPPERWAADVIRPSSFVVAGITATPG
ncbi:MAG: hypothetical protein V3T70_05480, partial [Phycisphaerae bacterium]